MAADTSIVKPVEAPPLAPLHFKSKLAATPTSAPKYAVQVKNAAGADVTLADPRATRALVALMDVHAVVGGAACHWGGPAAFAEMNAAIHGIMFATQGREWHEAFNYVNDAGHAENGIYALRALYGFDGMTFETLKGFRSIHSKLTGHGESHINPEGVLLSNGPLGSSLPQAQGLAIGDKIAGRKRVTICVVSDGASMEGEAKEAFAAIPGLAAKERLNPFVLLISDNDTKLSGRITKDAFSMQPSFSAMSTLGWSVIHVPDGGGKGHCRGAGESEPPHLHSVPDHQGLWHQGDRGKSGRRPWFSAGQRREDHGLDDRIIPGCHGAARTLGVGAGAARRLGKKGS
jgi:transketolase